MTADIYISRILRYVDPEHYEQYKRMSTPMLDRKHVGKVRLIFDNTIEIFGESEQKQSLVDIFIAATYQIFCPVSFIPATKKEGKDAVAAGKLPPGVRDLMAECLGIKHPEEINRLKKYVSSWMKPFYTGPERSFENKVKSVVDTIRPYSVNQWDHQYNLFTS